MTYIVTGASSGIGRATAFELAARGLPVVAVARSRDRLDELQSSAGEQMRVVSADLATPTGISRVVEALGPGTSVAGIVHGAGSLVPLEPYAVMRPESLTEHFRIHVAAPVALYQGLAAHHPVARMVFIDSYSATTLRPGWSAYSLIKAAAQMAARAAAAELPATRVIRVFPGAVNTPIIEAVLASDAAAARDYAAMGERGEIAEPADTAQFIVGLLVDVADAQLDSHETWDYNNPEDRALVGC